METNYSSTSASLYVKKLHRDGITSIVYQIQMIKLDISLV